LTIESSIELQLKRHPVKTLELTWSNIKQHVFTPISNDENNIFVSKTTKEALSDYSKSETYKDAKRVWKNLLIDSIFLLKLNDQREKLYSDTEELFGEEINATLKEFNDHFDNIRSSSTFGIDELGKYFDDFVNFESVLYGTGEFYRDHIHHVLLVWGVGINLLEGSEPIEILKLNDKFNYSDVNFHFQVKKNKPKTISRSELWSMWTIIALCHDLGYPLEKASQINQQVRKIVNHFGTLNFNELNYNFDLLNNFLVDKYLKIISSKTSRTRKECGNDKNCEENGCQNKSENKTIIQSKYHDKFSKSLEDYKHGILSGLLIFKKLTYFLETDYASPDNSLSCEDLRQFYIRKEILRSICGHTCPKIYHIDLNTLSFLLILCDELQESGRPRFEELLLGKTEEAIISKLNTFSVTETEVKTDKEDKTDKIKKIIKSTIHISIEYTKIDLLDDDPSEKRKEYEDKLIRKKFQHFHYLLRSAKEDLFRNIDFCLELIFKDKIKYVFHFNSEKSSFDGMIISKWEKLEGNKETGKFILYPDPDTPEKEK